MFFRKSVHKDIDGIISKIQLKEGGFLEIPDLNCRIAQDKLRYADGRCVGLNFAESQLLTRKLSKDSGARLRLPRISEEYRVFQKLKSEWSQPEWKAEYLDGSFLMLNPEVRTVRHPRRYDFSSPSTTIVEMPRYLRNNGDLQWLGISKDEYDRSAFVSAFNGDAYSVCAMPPLSKDCLGVRLLIDENKI